MAVQISGNDITVPRDGTFSRNVSIAGTLTYEDVTNVDSIGLVTARNGIEIGASPGVAASISVDGNMIVSGITTIGGDIKVGSGVTIGKDGHLFATGVTTSTTVKVGAAVTISESGIEASGIGITCASINGTQIGGRRNIIINGDMQVAQRATSSTSAGYTTVDRWSNSYSHDATMTFTQHALTSSDSGPYEEGFRYSHHATNGSTSADAGQYYEPQQPIEAQNVSLSGWNYKSSTSFITLSFWVKSSVGQEYQAGLLSTDGTLYKYPFAFTLSADTWTKVVKTIPGNSNLQIDNDNGEGLRVSIVPYFGTNYTDNSVSHDAWSTWSSSARWKDSTTTWWTTNGATFEFTGVQLEVGSQATPFEHRSFGEEFALCQRYYIQYGGGASGTLTRFPMLGECPSTTVSQFILQFPVAMRGGGDVTLTTTGTASDYQIYTANASRASTSIVLADSMKYGPGDVYGCRVNVNRTNGDLVAGRAAQAYSSVSGAFLGFSREL